MLSRVAETVYWMSRYVERAENVARFIGVNFQLMLDESTEEEQQWLPLVNTTGDHEDFAKRYDTASQENVIHFLTFDLANPNSIVSCLRQARDNARSVREIISSEMWLQLNKFYLMVKSAAATADGLDSANEFLSEVKEASHLFSGITDGTMSYGEAWHFSRLGRMLERADKTSRILDVKYYLLPSYSSLLTFLARPATLQLLGAEFRSYSDKRIVRSAIGDSRGAITGTAPGAGGRVVGRRCQRSRTAFSGGLAPSPFSATPNCGCRRWSKNPGKLPTRHHHLAGGAVGIQVPE
jgi:uncharacterized alpha-E superfamily protein